MNKILKQIDEIWSKKDSVIWDVEKKTQTLELINSVVDFINNGKIRAANKISGKWLVEESVKKAIILYFIFSESRIFDLSGVVFYDKIPMKLGEDNKYNFQESQTRIVPGSIVRDGVYIGKNVVIMPSFINIGAYIDDRTMIDSCVTIGSCAQIGKNCHISAGVTIGGVLEPIGNKPVIIEDNCFIGAGSQILEGVIVEENSILASGVVLSGSTKIIYRDSGDVIYGYIPKNSVVVSGSYGGDGNKIPSVSCAVIVKNITQEIRTKLSINEILRN